MRSCVLLFAGLALAAIHAGCSPARSEHASTDPQQTTLTIRDRDWIITLKDAQDIRAAVDQYLATARPPLQEGVSRPGDVHIDFGGTVRMGDWMLEPSYSEPADVLLTLLVEENALVRIDQVIEIKRVGPQWKAIGTSVRTAHRRY